MAKAAAKPKKEVSMEEALWKSADKLRGSVEPAEYKHVVLSLFFLKFASDKFEAQRKTIAEKFGEKFIDNVAFYTKVQGSAWRMKLNKKTQRRDHSMVLPFSFRFIVLNFSQKSTIIYLC